MKLFVKLLWQNDVSISKCWLRALTVWPRETMVFVNGLSISYKQKWCSTLVIGSKPLLNQSSKEKLVIELMQNRRGRNFVRHNQPWSRSVRDRKALEMLICLKKQIYTIYIQKKFQFLCNNCERFKQISSTFLQWHCRRFLSTQRKR